MHVGDIDVLDEVLVPRRAALHAHAAAGLGAVLGEGCPLDVAEMRNRDHDVFVGIEVFRVELFFRRTDFGPSGITVLVLELQSLSLDDLQLLDLAAENLVAAGDELLKVFLFSLKFLPFESGELAQTHLDDCGCLHFRESETGDEFGLGLIHIG